jgi:tRNA dimethylallyltransferase
MSAIAEPASSAAVSRPGGAPKIRVGFIVGPTGAGKSRLAMEIAERLGADIVNADSRQFYCGMDVGTAKPSVEDRRRVPHHLIDVREAGDPLDVADFAKLARTAITSVAARGGRPLVVGGSGLYLRVLRHGIFEGPRASAEIREKYAKIADEKGVAYLHERLREIDPEAAARIGVNDLFRITRALEVFELTGETITTHHRRHRFAQAEYESLTIGVEVERKALYEAIDARFDEMITAGLVDEVRSLIEAGMVAEQSHLSTIGHRQIAAYLRGEMTLAEAIAIAKRDSRRLAKRQLTWFRAEPDIVWLDARRGSQDAFDLLDEFFTRTR